MSRSRSRVLTQTADGLLVTCDLLLHQHRHHGALEGSAGGPSHGQIHGCSVHLHPHDGAAGTEVPQRSVLLGHLHHQAAGAAGLAGQCLAQGARGGRRGQLHRAMWGRTETEGGAA